MRFESFLKIILAGAIISLPYFGVKEYKQSILKEEARKSQRQISELESSRIISSASFQDLNLDGTNELVVADGSGRTTTLWRYDNPQAGISNRYFSVEHIREIKARELEQGMNSYQPSPQLPSLQGRLK